MAKVNIVNVMVLDNPSPFLNPFQFEITFEALEDLSEDGVNSGQTDATCMDKLQTLIRQLLQELSDLGLQFAENVKNLEWKIIYVGAAESEEYDQTLETILVGPVPGGRHKFVFQAGPPDTSKIPVEDAVGVTVVLLTCSYRNKEFIRVGYYVNNEYDTTELREEPPTGPQYDKLQRNILATRPRVTRFKIDWDDNPTTQENSENIPPAHSLESESNQMVPSGASKALADSKPQVVPDINTNSAMEVEEVSESMS